MLSGAASREEHETHLTLCNLNRQLTTTTPSVPQQTTDTLIASAPFWGGANVMSWLSFFCRLLRADVAIFGAALPKKQQQTTDTATAAIALSSTHVMFWHVSTFIVSIGLMCGLIWHFRSA